MLASGIGKGSQEGDKPIQRLSGGFERHEWIYSAVLEAGLMTD